MIGTARSEFPAAKYCHCHHEAMASSSRAVGPGFSSYPEVVVSLQVNHEFSKKCWPFFWKISSKGWSGFSHWKGWFSIVFCMLSYSSHSCPISIASCSPLRPVVFPVSSYFIQKTLSGRRDSAVTCVAHPPPTWSPEGARSPPNTPNTV